MQHDLFHVYTVDEHILMVIRNLRRFTEAQHAHEYPLCSRLIADFERKEVLYLAGLFHDIAKGRGGDHSVLGARDAQRFCRAARTVAAKTPSSSRGSSSEHLTMSQTAQKQDITDPAVVDAFAAKVGDERRLVALYLLTVADIRGTSPEGVERVEGQAARRPVPRDARRAADGDERAHAARQHRASGSAKRSGCCDFTRCPKTPSSELWRELDTLYLQRHTADEIAWHARHLYWRIDGTTPVVKVRLAREGAGLQALVYLPDQKALFARICGFFGRAGLSILEAKVHTTRHGYALDTFALHDPVESQRVVSRDDPVHRIRADARADRTRRRCEPPAEGRIPRQLRHFPLTPEIQIFPDDKGTHFILEVVAGDRPGPARTHRLRAGAGERQRRQRADQYAGRARGRRVPDRRRAAARRAGAAAAGDRALRAVAGVTDDPAARACALTAADPAIGTRPASTHREGRAASCRPAT